MLNAGSWLTLIIALLCGVIAGTTAGWLIGAQNPFFIACVSVCVIVPMWLAARRKAKSGG